MRIIKYLILFLSFCLGVNAQSVGCNSYDSLGRKQEFWIEKVGVETHIGQYHDNDRFGQWVVYDSLQRIKRILSYVGGLLEGNILSLNEQGTVTKELTFVAGRLHGRVKFYSSSGVLLAIYQYSNDILSAVEYLIQNVESPPRNHTYYPDY